MASYLSSSNCSSRTEPRQAALSLPLSLGQGRRTVGVGVELGAEMEGEGFGQAVWSRECEFMACICFALSIWLMLRQLYKCRAPELRPKFIEGIHHLPDNCWHCLSLSRSLSVSVSGCAMRTVVSTLGHKNCKSAKWICLSSGAGERVVSCIELVFTAQVML